MNSMTIRGQEIRIFTPGASFRRFAVADVHRIPGLCREGLSAVAFRNICSAKGYFVVDEVPTISRAGLFEALKRCGDRVDPEIAREVRVAIRHLPPGHTKGPRSTAPAPKVGFLRRLFGF